MARPLHVRLPEKLMSRIEKIERLEDKSKTHIVITLLEEALSMRDFNVCIRGGLNPSPLGEDLSMVCGYGELS